MHDQYFLENESVKAVFAPKGAELISFFNKATGLEYIWQADPKIWSRHAPLLFPIVGRLKNDTFRVKGNSYNLSQHGFARDKTFSLEKHDPGNGELQFKLVEDEETLSSFPFRFEFLISYKLEGNSLRVIYEVRNPSSDALYFSLGAHPGFNCPLNAEESFEEYYLEFGEKETLSRHLLQGGLLTGKTEAFLNNSDTLPLRYDYFEKDAIVFKNFKSHTLSLKSLKGENGVQVSFAGFPYLGIWTKQAGAPFLCIEPWYGIADNLNSSGLLVEKEGIMKLAPEDEFECEYQITIF